MNSTVHKNAEKYETIDPEFARKTRKHFYVDDLTTCVHSVEEGTELYKKFKLRFMEANFIVRKWRTNNNELKNKLEIIESQENIHNSELIQKSSIKKIETDDNCSITNRKVCL